MFSGALATMLSAGCGLSPIAQLAPPSKLKFNSTHLASSSILRHRVGT